MKKFLPILALLALMCACNPDNPEDDNVGGNKGPLSLSAEKMVFSSWGGERSVDVTSPKGKWSADVASDSREWISVVTSVGSGMSLTTKADGSTLTIRVSQNESDNSRTGTVTVSAEGKTVTLTVTQDGREETTADEVETSVSYSLSPGTSIAPKAMVQYIVSVDEKAGIIVIDKDIPAELLPSQGGLIINTPSELLPQGLLADIQTITQTADGYRVYYNELPFDRAFSNLDLNSESLDIEPYITEIVDADGNPLEFSTKSSVGSHKFHVEVSWPLSLSAVTITPKMSLDITLKTQLIMADGYLSTLNFKVDADVLSGMDYTVDVEVGPDDPWKKKVATIVVGAIPVGPLLLTPKIEIFLIANASGKVSFTASTTKKYHAMAWLHYDELAGLSCDIDKTEPEEVENRYELGGSMEASVSAGLGIGGAMGIYKDVLSAGMSLNALVTGSLSTPISLEALKNQGPGGLLGQSLVGAELATKLELSGTASLSASISRFSFEIEQNTPSASIDLKKYKLFPQASEEKLMVLQNGSTYIFQTTLNAPSLLSGIQGSALGELVAICTDKKGNEKWAPFNIDERIVKNIWADEDTPQPIEARMNGLTVGEDYICTFGWRIGDLLLPFNLKAGIPFTILKSEDVNDIREILRDVKACASNEWEGCNWDQDLMIQALKNVSVSPPRPDSEDKRVFVDVTIPKEWKLGSTLHVGSHSSGNNIVCRLYIEGGNRKFDTVELLDKGSYAMFGEGDETRVFIFRGQLGSGFPSTTEKWDVSGSGMGEIPFPCEGHEGYPSIILADNCPNITWIAFDVPAGKQLKTLSLKNNVVRHCEIGVTGSITNEAMAGLSGVTSTDEGRKIVAVSDMSSFSIGCAGPTVFRAQNVGTVTVSGASDLRTINIGKGVSGLSISNCPKLETLYASGIDLTSFSIAKPLSTYFNGFINDNKKLKGVIPNSWSGISLIFDVRYSYATLGYNERPSGSGWVCLKKEHGYDQETGEEYFGASYWYKDNGYGWHYSGEPQNMGGKE